MSDQRIVFRKEGRAKYISHLDLMRTMQRAFIRAGISVKHTEGFNPHPYMVFALPLPVGEESACEMMDFSLVSPDIRIEDVPALLNPALPEGITVTDAYGAERKFRDIVWLGVSGKLIYDAGLPDGAAEKLGAFFASEHIVIAKKTKRGTADTDIRPCIKSAEFTAEGGAVAVRAVLAAQNPSLNPGHLVSALRQLAPELNPDFAEFRRTALYDGNLNNFR